MPPARKVCAVFGCNPKNDERKFHRFPKDRKYSDIWVHKCCRKDIIDVKFAKICEKHFSSSQKTRNLKYELLGCALPSNYRDLKPDAIPDLELPTHPDKDNHNAAHSKGEYTSYVMINSEKKCLDGVLLTPL